MIHGPSGCGKSSLVSAGLLPQLADHVRSIYVEATPDDTEAELLRKLRVKCKELTKTRKLGQILKLLSKGEAIPSGQKVLIVLDQFEQWLQVNWGKSDTELVKALRHCDGIHLQAIVLIRHDFWTQAEQFSIQTNIKFDRTFRRSPRQFPRIFQRAGATGYASP